MLTSSATVCIIGFGESGATVGAALAQRGHAVRAWDNQLGDAEGSETMRSRMSEAMVEPAASLIGAVTGAKLVICAVDETTGADIRHEVHAMLVAGQLLMNLDASSPAAQLEALGFTYDPAMRQTPQRGELP
jgi:3-hydroxyisobutyrate dehydrogenase-like beta-hydroxyacid dehydrogenase